MNYLANIKTITKREPQRIFHRLWHISFWSFFCRCADFSHSSSAPGNGNVSQAG